MLRLRETANQLAMANNDRWYGHLLRREESHALSSLDFEVEGQRKKGWPRSTLEEAGWGINCEGWLEHGKCTSLIKWKCWHRSDFSWVEVNLATLTCWGPHQIINIGLPFTSQIKYYKNIT